MGHTAEQRELPVLWDLVEASLSGAQQLQVELTAGRGCCGYGDQFFHVCYLHL